MAPTFKITLIRARGPSAPGPGRVIAVKRTSSTIALVSGILLMAGCAQQREIPSTGTTPAICDAHTPEQEAAYRQALGTFRKSNFAEAKDAFTKYTTNYPKDRLVYNAYFWLGNALYALQDYPGSVNALIQVANAHQQRFAPEALLLVGNIHSEVGKPSEGDKAYWLLMSRYPDSEAAVHARLRLRLPASAVTPVSSNNYGARVASAIRKHVTYDGTDSPMVEVKVTSSCDGKILDRRITNSSGAPAWDAAVLRGLDKAEFMPLDSNGVVPGEMIITYRAK